ncbi:solute carrier family 35 member F5-like [Montipora capricornis]|uniref:solute carrier family 35 member F5-like n=1 Tax=Montipora capricornis TaxID=246305 RepID=UPI0035F1DB69
MAIKPTNCCYLCGCIQSLWRGTVRLIVSKEEIIRKRRRLVLGVIVLLLVDVIWVASAELSDFIFKDLGYDKPFFTTYFKTSSFIIFLAGFLFYEPWRLQCSCGQIHEDAPSDVVISKPCQSREKSPLLQSPSSSPLMNESVYEELPDSEKIRDHLSSDVENSYSFQNISKERKVTFSSTREVRQLSDHEAVQDGQDKLPLKKVAKVALIFCLLWFGASCSYQEAIAQTTPAAVNTLSCSSGLFTLILAAIFQSSAADKFTISKLLAVLVSITGIVLVTFSDSKNKVNGISVGALWALAGALLYSSYLTMLKRTVPDERQMSLPMFFGFVGAFNLFLLWPVLLFLDHFKWEVFEFPPNLSVWGYLTLNGLVGTVLTDLLWLWGCYLTSSLTATLCLGLVAPLTMTFDMCVRNAHFSWMFFVGAIPMFASFFAVSVLSHYGDWDPVLILIKKLVNSKQQFIERTLDTEQSESLIKSFTEDENCQEINRDEIPT